MTGALHRIQQAAISSSGGIYLGEGPSGPVWAGRERTVMVLGPPRSGKTSTIVIPTLLGSSGSVVSTSTKPDVMDATAAARSQLGRCFLYDPSGTVEPPPGVEPARWSPVSSCRSWDSALVTTHDLVASSQRSSPGHDTGASHWEERAEALLAPLLHAAALDGQPMDTVIRWMNRRQGGPALGLLDRSGAGVAADQLAGIMETDPREQSGIWSTASGALVGYRSDSAMSTTVDPNFDSRRFVEEATTIFICAAGRQQSVVAPLVVGLLGDIRSATYTHHSKMQAFAGSSSGDADRVPGQQSGSPVSPVNMAAHPVIFALDELANIAPIPDLPSLASEGAGQGLLTMACLQDLSQARTRWGASADGFLSLFSVTAVLPGIGDVRTLQGISALAGNIEVVRRSVNVPQPAGGPRLLDVIQGLRGRRPQTERTPTYTYSTQRLPRLPVEVLSRGRPGRAILLDERNQVADIRLTPWFAESPWREAAQLPRIGCDLDQRPPNQAPSRPYGHHRDDTLTIDLDRDGKRADAGPGQATFLNPAHTDSAGRDFGAPLPAAERDQTRPDLGRPGNR